MLFYQDKQKRLTGSADNWSQCVRISPAEELAICECIPDFLLISVIDSVRVVWNTHTRIRKDVAQEHITELSSLTPPVTIPSPLISKEAVSEGPVPDLDTPEEFAVRFLLLGILHRTMGEFEASRKFFIEAKRAQVGINTWVHGVATFELAVLELKETEAQVGSDLLVLDESKKAVWRKVIKDVNEKLNETLSLSGQAVDLSSRLDMRVAMLRDEVALKKDAVDGTA